MMVLYQVYIQIYFSSVMKNARQLPGFWIQQVLSNEDSTLLKETTDGS